jgi:hypothetical protein
MLVLQCGDAGAGEIKNAVDEGQKLGSGRRGAW